MKPEFHTFVLPSGIRCIHKQVRSEVAYCALSVNTGSRDELPHEHGVAHLTEHALFKGTRKRRAHHINSRLENLGGELNAFTTKEETVIHTTTLRGDFAKAVELVADLAFDSTFPPKGVRREKEIVLEELSSYRDSPSEMIFDEFEELIFGGSPLAHNILGTRAGVGRFDSASIRRFVDRTYNTDQMVVSGIGNISPKGFERAVRRWFGDAPGSLRAFSREAPPDVSRFEVRRRRGTHQAHCILGARAPGIDDPGRTALALLMNMLGGAAANSLLNVLVREQNGLSYNIEAGYAPFTDSGVATIYFGTDKQNVDACLELVHKQLNELRQTPVTPRRLSMAKKQFLGQLAISMEGNEGYMLGAARSFMLFGEVDSVEAVRRKVTDISAGELTDMANRVLGDISILCYI